MLVDMYNAFVDPSVSQVICKLPLKLTSLSLCEQSVMESDSDNCTEICIVYDTVSD